MVDPQNAGVPLPWNSSKVKIRGKKLAVMRLNFKTATFFSNAPAGPSSNQTFPVDSLRAILRLVHGRPYPGLGTLRKNRFLGHLRAREMVFCRNVGVAQQ